MFWDRLDYQFLQYLIEKKLEPGDRLPSLSDLSVELGVSVGKLREQLEVARMLGYVSVRPRLGIRREAYDFYPAANASMMFGLATGEASFQQISELRQMLEANMWLQAVSCLTQADKDQLRQLVTQAWDKLQGTPVHIPNGEHRKLHLTIFGRLENPFVIALLKSYWDAYEKTELTRFADYGYWLMVWDYHERIVDAICQGEYDCGQKLLVDHFQLLPTVTMPS
jgi:DNA-binding FadR family transcriptional regulator